MCLYADSGLLQRLVLCMPSASRQQFADHFSLDTICPPKIGTMMKRACASAVVHKGST